MNFTSEDAIEKRCSGGEGLSKELPIRTRPLPADDFQTEIVANTRPSLYNQGRAPHLLSQSELLAIQAQVSVAQKGKARQAAPQFTSKGGPGSVTKKGKVNRRRRRSKKVWDGDLQKDGPGARIPRAHQIRVARGPREERPRSGKLGSSSPPAISQPASQQLTKQIAFSNETPDLLRAPKSQPFLRPSASPSLLSLGSPLSNTPCPVNLSLSGTVKVESSINQVDSNDPDGHDGRFGRSNCPSPSPSVPSSGADPGLSGMCVHSVLEAPDSWARIKAASIERPHHAKAREESPWSRNRPNSRASTLVPTSVITREPTGILCKRSPEDSDTEDAKLSGSMRECTFSSSITSCASDMSCVSEFQGQIAEVQNTEMDTRFPVLAEHKQAPKSWHDDGKSVCLQFGRQSPLMIFPLRQLRFLRSRNPPPQETPADRMQLEPFPNLTEADLQYSPTTVNPQGAAESLDQASTRTARQSSGSFTKAHGGRHGLHEHSARLSRNSSGQGRIERDNGKGRHAGHISDRPSHSSGTADEDVLADPSLQAGVYHHLHTVTSNTPEPRLGPSEGEPGPSNWWQPTSMDRNEESSTPDNLQRQHDGADSVSSNTQQTYEPIRTDNNCLSARERQARIREVERQEAERQQAVVREEYKAIEKQQKRMAAERKAREKQQRREEALFRRGFATAERQQEQSVAARMAREEQQRLEEAGNHNMAYAQGWQTSESTHREHRRSSDTAGCWPCNLIDQLLRLCHGHTWRSGCSLSRGEARNGVPSAHDQSLTENLIEQNMQQTGEPVSVSQGSMEGPSQSQLDQAETTNHYQPPVMNQHEQFYGQRIVSVAVESVSDIEAAGLYIDPRAHFTGTYRFAHPDDEDRCNRFIDPSAQIPGTRGSAAPGNEDNPNAQPAAAQAMDDVSDSESVKEARARLIAESTTNLSLAQTTPQPEPENFIWTPRPRSSGGCSY